MPIEQVIVDFKAEVIYFARISAEQANLSLSEWLNKVAWEQSITEGAQRFAEWERLHPEDHPDWVDPSTATRSRRMTYEVR